MAMADEIKALKAYVPLGLKNRAFIKFIEQDISYSEWTRRALESWLAEVGNQNKQAGEPVKAGKCKGP